MAEPARQPLPDGEAVPEAVAHEEKTVEVPGVPESVLVEQDTVPVRSSLAKMLRHEMLRHQSSLSDE
ncbi:MAG TPA: hypothetical protein VN914_08150 [Polyangia bacterium]|nr:hypothetical protein [Polyangia bacterium]